MTETSHGSLRMKPCQNFIPSQQGSSLRPSAQAGFSLMEVLVGISVLGIVYASLFSLMNTSLRNVNRMEDREKILRYGQMKLNELVVRASQGTMGEELSGTFDDKYSWRAQVEPFDIGERAQPPPAFQVIRIRLSVMWETSSGSNRYALETMTWAPSQ